MKRKTRVIQISGIRGIIIALFTLVCLAAGFIGFPGLVAMYLWNYAASFTLSVPAINIFQGILLWAIAGISFMIINNKHKYFVAFQTPDKLSDEEIKKIMERVKLQAQARMLNSMMYISKDNEKLPEQNQDTKSDETLNNIIEEEKDIHKI